MTATNEKLSESEIRYKFLIDSIPDVIGELNLNGTINFVSPQVYDMLGYHPDEMIGTNIIKFIHPDDVPDIRKGLKKAIKSKKIMFPNLRLSHKKGNYVLVFAKGKLIKLDDKARLIGVIRDVTKLNETEKKLEESQDIFEQLNKVFMKFKEDPIFNLQLLINTAGLLLNTDCALFNVLKRVNGKEVLESLVTYNEPPGFIRESDAKGQICTDIIKDNPDDVVILSNLDKTNYVKTDENVRKYDLKQYVSYVVRFNNKPTATFCLVYTENREMSNSDITLLKILSKSASTELARWNHRMDLQKSEEKYRYFFNNAQIGLFWSGIIDGKFLECNDTFAKLVGYTSREECLADYIAIERYVNLKDRDKMLEKINTNGNVKNFEIQVLKKDGNPFWASISARINLKENRIEGAATDITERKKTEQKLKESEEKYRHLFENSPYYIILLDKVGNFIDCNNSALDIFGYPKEDLLGKNFRKMQIIPPELLPLLEISIELLIKGEILPPLEFKPIRKDGKIIWINSQVSLIKSDNEFFIYIIGQDITERKEAERKLKESEEKFRTISEQSLMGILILQDDRIKYINQAAVEMFGYTIEELLDTPQGGFINLIHPEDREFVREQATKKQIGMNDIITEYPYRGLTKSGETIWLQNYSLTITFEGKSADLITMIDITERKKTEKKLKESEEKYRALFENTPIGVALTDYEGDIIELNEHMNKLLGYELEELKNFSITAAYANDQDRIPFKNRIEAQGYVKDYEVDLKKKDGKVFPALLNSIKTNISGEPIYLTTIRDITEKKEIEEIKSHLLTRFSHEFKTPLISIKGFSDLLLSEYNNKLDEKMIGFLEKIKEGGDKLNLLVNTFMQSSQLGENLTRLNKDKENLSDLIKLGVSELEGLINLRKHTIYVDIPEELIGEFDKEKIYTVITNLLMNAIKYTPPEGKIFIHSKIEEGDIFFSIKDSGIGLTEEEKRHLFKPLGKIERYGKGWDVVSGGMGVGLYLSKEIIDLHGGKIWAESEGKNKGSTFYFSLPMTNN